MINPYICNIALDANALDRHGDDRDEFVERFERLVAEEKLSVVIGSGVRQEVSHPKTPRAVKSAILPQIFNLQPNLNEPQNALRKEILAIMHGNAKNGQHTSDANHLCEADETGCSYFITNDKRILAKKLELSSAGLTLSIVTMRGFFEILDDINDNH
jgi:hypothetical protein